MTRKLGRSEMTQEQQDIERAEKELCGRFRDLPYNAVGVLKRAVILERAEVIRLRRELEDIRESYKRAIESPCPGEKHCTCVPALRRENEELKAKYDELLFSVGKKFENATRHQTALRYIQSAENTCDNNAKQSTVQP